MQKIERIEHLEARIEKARISKAAQSTWQYQENH